MNGESSDEYKKSLEKSSSDNIKPLVYYIEKQKNFIEENKRMF